jgi:hypothetical protein
MHDEHSRPISAAVPAAGLPRPRLDGLPLPWITLLGPDGPEWKRIASTRVLHCQANWACQVCGQPLRQRAWVMLTSDGTVLSDAALHFECMVLARRWCPHLQDSASGVDAVEVDCTHIHADDEPLHLIADYGDETRAWTVARNASQGLDSHSPKSNTCRLDTRLRQ